MLLDRGGGMRAKKTARATTAKRRLMANGKAVADLSACSLAVGLVAAVDFDEDAREIPRVCRIRTE